MENNESINAALNLPQRRRKSIESQFRNRYIVFQYNFVEFLTEHLVDLSRSFKGDLSEMLVLALIGQMTLGRSIADSKERPAVNNRPPLITASRLADVSGIPRQTVRRKLKSLETRGWIERSSGSSWMLTVIDGHSAVHQELRELDDRAVARVAKLYLNLEKLLHSSSDP